MINTVNEIENNLAKEEAIQLLKMEVMVQDWSLSSRRGAAIGEALKTLHPHFLGLPERACQILFERGNCIRLWTSMGC